MEIKKKKKIIIFEMDDTDGKKEYTGIHRYVEPFRYFIQSLGFELSEPEGYMVSTYEEVAINGTKLYFDYGKALFMSKNTYTRDWDERKDRWVEIRTNFYGRFGDNTPPAIRIRINQEIDGDQLKTRIQKLVDYRKTLIEKADTRDQTNKNNVTLFHEWLKKSLSYREMTSFSIEMGTYSISFGHMGRLSLTGDGKFKSFKVFETKFDSHQDLANYSDFIKRVNGEMSRFLSSIENNWIGVGEFKEWASTAQNQWLTIKQDTPRD